MKERLKSILLFFLVIMSIYMTYLLWISFPESSIFTKKSTALQVDIFHIIRPQYTIINLDNDKKEYVKKEDQFLKLWENTIAYVKNCKSIKDYNIDKSTWDEKGRDFSLHFYMYDGFNAELFKELLSDNKTFFKKLNGSFEISEVLFDLENGWIYIKNNKKDKYSALECEGNTKNITNYIKSLNNQDVTVCQTVYQSGYNDYFINGNLFLPTYNKDFTIEKLFNKDIYGYGYLNKIISNLFINMSVVREINENSGFIVYTDGIRSLRFHKSDFIEFYNTSTDNNLSDQNASLNFALNFLSQTGISLNKIHLATIKKLNNNYEFYFNYNANLPLRVLDKYADYYPIVVKINGGDVKYAFIKLLNLYPGGYYADQILSPEKILKDISETLKIKMPIDNLKLVYLYKDNHLIPSWELKKDKNIYYINAFDGKLIDDGV